MRRHDEELDYSMRYQSGEEIHIGDHIQYARSPGVIVFVIGRDEFEGESASEREWFKKEYGKGFMIRTKGMGLVLLDEADEDLEFLSRKDGQ